MNDIEKQIEGVNDEEGVDMNRLNSNNNDKKKIIMYVVGGFIALLLVGAIIYLVIVSIIEHDRFTSLITSFQSFIENILFALILRDINYIKVLTGLHCLEIVLNIY